MYITAIFRYLDGDTVLCKKNNNGTNISNLTYTQQQIFSDMCKPNSMR